MMNKLLSIFQKEKGFTLIEIVIAIAVGGVIIAAFTSLLYNSLTTSQSNNYKVAAIRNLDVAGNWFNRDFQSAQTIPASVTITPGSGNMTIIQSIDNVSDRNVSYSISSNRDLIRTIGSQSSRITEKIESLTYQAGSGIAASTFTITAKVKTAIVTRIYESAPRITDANSVLSIFTDTLHQGDVGISYEDRLEARGGTPPYSWSFLGSFPGWATFTSSTGTITGNNPTLGTYSFTAKLTDSAGTTISKDFVIAVFAQPHNIMPISLPSGYIGQNYSPITFSVSDGSVPKQWSYDILPSGLNLSSNGVLYGTPSSDAVSTTTKFTVTDGSGVSVMSSGITLLINGPLAVVTNDATGIAKKSATLNGYLTGLGTATIVTVSFEWGTTMSYGNTATGTPSPIGSPTSFSTSLSSLSKATTYHFRTKAVGNNGFTVWGSDRTFTTLP
jgi:prepilin-type N-terminal cleavage/methylation domain-containing protein